MIRLIERLAMSKIADKFIYLICLAAILAMLAPMGVHATEKLCAPGLWPEPTMDGDLDSDSGWIRANEFTFSNGLPEQYGYARLMMGREYSLGSNNHLYLSVRVNQDPTFDPEDVIILMTGSTTTNGIYQKIAIYPVDVAGAATAVPGVAPKDIQYWEASTSSPSLVWTSMPLPAWLRDSVTSQFVNIWVLSSSTAAPNPWYQLEMKFPVNIDPSKGLALSTTTDFRMYVNTIRMQPDPLLPGSSITPEVYWPQGADITYGDINNTPQPNQWGLASLAGPCSGVHVTRAYTNNPDTVSVNVNRTDNIFTAEITNSGPDPAGRVQAEVRSSRFGLPGPGYYGHVPWPGNPMTTLSGINSGQTVSVSTLPWNLVTDPSHTAYINNSGLCSEVVLSAISGNNTYISNRNFNWNMHFSTASKFSHTAVLDANGYRKRRDGSNREEFILMTSISNDLALDDASRLEVMNLKEPLPIRNQTDELKKRIASMYEDARLLRATSFIEKKARFFEKFVCGYRRTGEFITIKGRTAEVVEPANCYGYLLAHQGEISEWRDKLLVKGGLQRERGNAIGIVAEKNKEGIQLSTEVETGTGGGNGGICQTLKIAQAGTLTGGLVFSGFAVYWPSRRKRNE